MNSMLALKKALRNVVADYMYSEGCSCCQDIEQHEIDKARLAKLLDVPEFDDKSGYNFSQFRTNENPKKDKL